MPPLLRGFGRSKPKLRILGGQTQRANSLAAALYNSCRPTSISLRHSLGAVTNPAWWSPRSSPEIVGPNASTHQHSRLSTPASSSQWRKQCFEPINTATHHIRGWADLQVDAAICQNSRQHRSLDSSDPEPNFFPLLLSIAHQASSVEPHVLCSSFLHGLGSDFDQR